jgi:hypothetical protein
MGLFGNSAAPAAGEEKPLPDPTANMGTKRPGTSGTELGLRAEKNKASAAYQRAQRAEAAYRAKRQARNAKQEYTTPSPPLT